MEKYENPVCRLENEGPSNGGIVLSSQTGAFELIIVVPFLAPDLCRCQFGIGRVKSVSHSTLSSR